MPKHHTKQPKGGKNPTGSPRIRESSTRMPSSLKLLLFGAGALVLVIGIFLHASNYRQSDSTQEEEMKPQSELAEKRQFIRETFLELWTNLGMNRTDEFGPSEIAISGLSRLLILGLDEEYNRIKSQLPHHIYRIIQAVSSPNPADLKLKMIKDSLTGLLSAYAISGERDLLDQAERIGQLLGPNSTLGKRSIDLEFRI